MVYLLCLEAIQKGFARISDREISDKKKEEK